MQETGSGNLTTISHIILLGFWDLKDLWILLFTGFLAVYIISMAANLLLVVLVLLDPHLQTPAYFFLSSLSCLEMVSTSNISPVMLAGLQTGNVMIYLGGCLAQLYLFGALATVECFLLEAMSYDWYLAVCRLLHYPSLMDGRVWRQLVVGLSCTDTSVVQMITFFLSFIPASPLLLTVASYVCISWAVLRVPFASGRRKAFSTCSSHLTVVTLFYGMLVAVYMSPGTARS
ncbi:olfactory receptor 11A1-like [Natator depressus]|uniref:olfactory receptor 11A1-like n=1 Tax=Natator depressus TaxID=27790 RepID=UPI003EB81BB0